MYKTTITNNEIKRIKSLSSKKFRDEYSEFVLEGEKMVSEAIASGFEVKAVYRTEDIGSSAMERMSQLSSPSPVLAVVGIPSEVDIKGDVRQAAKKIVKDGGLFLALDTIRDPGNMGTIIRIADWFGIDAVFATPESVDIFNPKVVQATMGAIFRVKFRYAPVTEVCKAVLDAGGKVYGTFLDGDDMYTKTLSCGKDTPSLVITGNESNGISDEVGKLVSDRLYIPPYPADQPGSESLNAAMATGIVLSEFRRQGRQ